MKITFDAVDFAELLMELTDFLEATTGMKLVKKPVAEPKEAAAPPAAPAPPVQKSKGGRPKGFKVKAKAKPVEKTVEKVVEKAAEKPVEKPASLDDLVLETPEEPVIDMTKLTALRVKTTEDLQAAYSNGKHKQVLELLSTYGNGAKSFRELAIRDFIPIRKAIDEGALQ